MNFFDEAKEKLDRELKSGSFDKYGNVMKNAVHQALLDFCRQDEEFAQAVAQGGSFADCMHAVAKGVVYSISDIDAYKKAVRFYFPGADISVQMKIDLIGDAAKNPVERVEEKKPACIILNLEDFLV